MKTTFMSSEMPFDLLVGGVGGCIITSGTSLLLLILAEKSPLVV